MVGLFRIEFKFADHSIKYQPKWYGDLMSLLWEKMGLWFRACGWPSISQPSVTPWIRARGRGIEQEIYKLKQKGRGKGSSQLAEMSTSEQCLFNLLGKASGATNHKSMTANLFKVPQEYQWSVWGKQMYNHEVWDWTCTSLQQLQKKLSVSAEMNCTDMTDITFHRYNYLAF